MLAMAATACGKSDSDPWLRVLRQERVARLVPGQGELILDTAMRGRDTAFSKPTSVAILRAFRYRTRGDAGKGRDIALRVAAHSGWRVNLRRKYETDPYAGAKRLSAGDATLWIGEYKKGSHYVVTIELEQGTCPPALCGRP